MSLFIGGKIRKKASSVGIDITSKAVQLLELSEVDNKLCVEAYSICSLPSGAVDERTIIKAGEVGTAIQSAIHSSEIRLNQVIAAVPSSSIINKIISMPSGLTDDQMETLIALDADQHIPYPIEEVALDFEVLGNTPGRQDRVDVLLVACRRESVDQCLEVLELAGMAPKVVDIEIYALERAYELVRPTVGLDVAATAAIINIGASTTTISVLNRGVSVYADVQAFGGKKLIDEIVSRYGVDPPEAELLLRQRRLRGYEEEELCAPFAKAIAQQVVNQDSVGELVPSANGGLVPSIDTTELTTQVLVGNGETVVLGGVFRNEETQQIQKVPVLGDLPGVGTLFRSTANTNKKVETLIFITPRILSEVLLD